MLFLKGQFHVRDLVEFLTTLNKEPILDKIRAEVIAKYPKNYAGEPELNGNACEFSLNQILQITRTIQGRKRGMIDDIL